MNEFRPRQFSLLPIAVKNILIINGLMLFATFVFNNVYHIDLNDYLGLFFPKSPHFRPWQLVTHMFMHGSFMHLFSNMLAFYMFGSVLENYWGTRRFVIFYLLTGVGAALCYLSVMWFNAHQTEILVQHFLNHPTPSGLRDLLFTHHLIDYMRLDQNYIVGELIQPWESFPRSSHYANEAVDIMRNYQQNMYNLQGTESLNLFDTRFATNLVGASGAVFGVLFAFGYLFPNTIIYFQFFIPIKAKYFVMIYGALELYAMWQNNPNDNVAHLAHLGGMLFAFILIRFWNRRIKNNLF